MKKKIFLIALLIFILFLITCTMPIKKNRKSDNNKSTKYDKYDLTTESGLLNLLNDEEYLLNILNLSKNSNSLIMKTAANFIYGDVNGDGFINSTDAVLTAQYYVGTINPDFLFPDAADVNDDGIINIIDAMMIANFEAGNINDFPAEKNYFLNGHFHAGDKNWEYFDQYNGDGTSDVIDGEYKITINNGGDYIWSIGCAQIELNLEVGKEYTFTFRARTNSLNLVALQTSFQLQQEPWTGYDDRKIFINQEMRTFTFDFIMPVTDNQTGFNFHLGAPNNSCDIFIDDVGLYEKKTDKPATGELINGDFSDGLSNWELYANDPGRAYMYLADGELIINVDNTGDYIFDIGVEQEKLLIQNSGNYSFSFKARADSPKKIWALVQKAEDPWTLYSDNIVVNLTTEMQTFTIDFTMLNITDESAQLVFHVSNDTSNVYIDDITLIKEGPTPVNMPTPLFRGINLSNTFDAPIEGEWGEDGLMQEEYFEEIKNVGFDHIRIPIRWSTHAEYDPPYTIDPAFFDRIDWAVNKTLDRNMTAVINMHHYRELNGNTPEDSPAYPENILPIGPEYHKDRFIEMWAQIAEHYKDYPEELYFEIYNEPNNQFTYNLWNEYMMEVYNIIRSTNPTRKIIITPANYGDIYSLDTLELPPNDPNIIVTVHFYRPVLFCMQQVTWLENPPPASSWNATPQQRAEITDSLDFLTQWQAEHNNIPVWNSEFCVHQADMDSRVRWITFVTRECEKRGIAYAYWGFMNDEPRLYDTSTNTWFRPNLLNALLPE